MKDVKWHLFVVGCILLCLSSRAWAQTVSFGQTQSGTISTAAQTNAYTFSANANDVVDFTLVATTGSLVPKIQLYNSVGTLISSNYSGAPFGCSGSTVEMNTVQIPATGTFTVVVSDCSSTNTGDYVIYIQRTNSPSGAAVLPFAQVQTGAITSPAQSDTHTFSANANVVVDFTIYTSSGSLVPKIRLYNPNGTLNSSNYSGAPFGCSGSTLEMNTVTLPVTGTYTLLVGDCGDTKTGNYEIYAQSTDSPAGPVGLLFGQVQAGSIVSATQSNTFAFTANASDVVDFTLVTTNGSLVPKIRLYNPNGTLNSSNYSGAPFGCGGSTLEMNTATLPVTGTYTMLVGDCGDTNTGTYSIYSQRTNNPTGAANLPFAQVQTGLVGSVTQSYTYTFTANASDVVDFTLVTTNGSLVPKIRLYNPNGTLNSSNYSGAPFGCGGSRLEMNTATLLVTGTYTVLVGDCGDTNTGNFAIYLQRTNNPTGAVPVLWGQVQTGMIGSVAQSNTYTFNGTANDGVQFTMVTTGGSLVPKIRLYNPDGRLNSSNYGGAPFGCGGTTVQLGSVTLTQTGTYTVLVGDCSDSSTGNYNFSSQCFGACQSPAAATPTFSIPSGTYTTPQTVAISDATAGATIFYTTNGTTPTTASTQYTGTIMVNSTETIEAIATASGFSTSAVATATYTITTAPQTATPAFSIPSGTYTSAQTVTISDATAGAAIYYTTDGTIPTTASTPYTGPITVGSTETIKAIATASGFANSNVASATYTIASLPIAGVAPSSLTFSAQNTDTSSASQPVTLSNTGSATLSISSIGISGDFSQTNNCGSSVAANTSCTVSLTFKPTTSGTRIGTLTITDNNNLVSGSVQTVSLTGSGVPTATTTALVVTPTTAAFGSLFTLDANVRYQSGNPVLNGSVTFYDGSALLGAVQVVRTTSGGATAGTATLKTILVPLGASSITAKYVGGDLPSTSPSVAANVTGKYPTTTTFTYIGSPAAYTLQGTVAGAGPANPTGNVTFTDTTTSSIVGTATLDPTTLTQKFVSTPTLTGFSGPLWAALADVNGDGIPDLFVGDANGLTVELGNADGTFQAPKLVLRGATDASPSSAHVGIAFGDFNGDGKLDAVVAIGGNIIVLLGNGDGTFRTAGSYDSGNPNQPLVGDFNGDGILDIVVFNSSSVDLLLGNGDGTFQSPVSYPVSSPLSLAAGDLNGDGLTDVVVGTSPNSVGVFLGTPKGTLQAGSTYATQYEPGNLLLADFRGNGDLDLVTVFNQCCEGTNTAVNLMLGNGNGTFQAEHSVLSGTNYSGLAVGDLNGDGKLDLVVSDYGFPAFNVLLGNGDGTFQTGISYSAGIGPITPVVADLNHDGRPDIVVANFNDGTADIFLNQVTQTATLNDAIVLGSGQQSVTAAYAGDTNFASSTSPMATLIGASPTVSLSPTSLTFAGQLITTTSSAQSVTLTNSGTAPLTISSIAITGTNASDFALTNTCPASSATLAVNASCTISVTFTSSATGSRTASVTTMDNASGNPHAVSLAGTGTDFSLDAAGGSNCPSSGNCSTSATVSAGQTATYNLQVTPSNGFNGAVALACLGAPGSSTCTVSPPSLPPSGSTSYAFTVTVGNTSNVMLVPQPRFRGIPGMPNSYALLLLPILAFAFWAAKPGFTHSYARRALGPAVAVLFLCVLYSAACGGGGGGGGHQPPTNAVLKVTGTSNGVNRTLSLNLTVNH